MNNDKNEHINFKYIEDFVEIAGIAPMNTSIDLFKGSVEKYFSACADFFAKGLFEDAGKELHKIKGAASSIGLANIMTLAKKVELDLLAQRENFNYEPEIKVLKDELAIDLVALEEYVQARMKK